MPVESIITNPIRDIIFAFIFVHLHILYGASFFMMPYQLTLLVEHEYPIISYTVRMGTDEDVARVATRVPFRDVH